MRVSFLVKDLWRIQGKQKKQSFLTFIFNEPDERKKEKVTHLCRGARAGGRGGEKTCLQDECEQTSPKRMRRAQTAKSLKPGGGRGRGGGGGAEGRGRVATRVGSLETRALHVLRSLIKLTV